MPISPLDGRYAGQLGEVDAAFSESALVQRRFAVEVAWLRTLAARPDVSELGPIPEHLDASLGRWVEDWGSADTAAVKAIEATTNHDVKAVEYHLKSKLAEAGADAATLEFVHFALTSAWVPAASGLVDAVAALARAHAAVPMLAHTHGQPATPTTLGKELAVFVARWRRQLDALARLRLLGKLNGATGTFSAHVAAYPEVPWSDVSRSFVEGLGLAWNPLTTQIEPHDSMSEAFHLMIRFNTITLDFCRDAWEYVSRGYLRQRSVAGEVGSSTMPHKVNPIDFENAEANLGVSTALLEHLATKLPVSRMQRDLSDSSAIRNVGVAVGHSALAMRAALRGLGRVEPDADAMATDLDGNWEVLAEAVQTVMRRYGLPEPYERLKELTRGARVDAAAMRTFVSGLGLPAEAEARLLALTPATYTGIAAQLVERYLGAAGAIT